MKDTTKGLRMSIFNALSGVLSYDSVAVPVQDEKIETVADRYVILSTQSGVPDNNQQTFITKSEILLYIVDKSDNTVSKDTVDDIANQILEILFPTPSTIGFFAPAGFQYLNAERSEQHTDFNISPTDTISRKLLTISADIIQQ